MTLQPASLPATAFIRRWSEKGLLSPSQQELLQSHLTQLQTSSSLPLGLTLLAAIGSLIASICFVGFLTISPLFHLDSNLNLLAWGSVFIGLACIIERAYFPHPDTFARSFARQSAFSLITTGKVLAWMGLSGFFSAYKGSSTFSLLALTVITYPLYAISLDRFFWSLASLASGFGEILYSFPPTSMEVRIYYDIYFTALLSLTLVLLTRTRLPQLWRPLVYASSLALGFALLQRTAFLMPIDLNFDLFQMCLQAVLTLALIFTITRLSGGLSSLKRQPIALAAAGALMLGLITTPTVILALLLLTWGYARQDSLLLVFTTLYLAFALFLYYYDLHFTLLTKSGILIASGLCLLIAYGYMVWRKWNQEA